MALTIPKSLSGSPASIKSQAEALLARATTITEVNSIQTLARNSNVTLNSTLVNNTKTAIADSAQKSTATAAAKTAADAKAAAAAKATADAAAAAKAATAPGTVPYAAKALGISEAEFSAAAQKLISSNPTYKNRDVAYVASTIGAKSGDLGAQVKTQDKAIKDLAIADKAAQSLGYADAATKKQAEQTAANKIAADKAAEKAAAQQAADKAASDAAEKAAAEKAAADAAAQALGYADVAAQKTAEINTAQNDFIKKLNSGAVTPQDIADYKNAVTGAGGTVQDTLVNRATTAISQTFQNQFVGANTPEEAAAIVKQAQDAGAPINQGYIDQSNKAFVQKAAAAEQAKQQELTNTLVNKLYNNETGYPRQITQSELDAVKKEAADKNVTIPESFIQKSQAQVDRTAKDAAWSPPSASSISTTGSQQSYATAPSGLQLIGLPEDPTTGQKAGWYVDTGAGYQAWDKGPSGSVIPYDNFNQTAQTTFNNVTNAKNEQERLAQEAKITNDVAAYNKALPEPGSEKFNLNVANAYINSGPGGYEYQAIAPNKATGAEGYWAVKAPGSGSYTTLDGTAISKDPFAISKENTTVNNLLTQLQDAGIDKATAVKLGTQGSSVAQEALTIQTKANNDARNAAIRAQNEARDAESRARQQAYDDQFSGKASWDATVSEFRDLVKAVAIVGIVAGVSSLVSGMANGVAGLAEGAEAATGLAESGMGASEIAATLEASGVPTAAADIMAEQAVGIATGTIDAAAVASASGLTPEMIAIANATADPIAAAAAQAGWGVVDTAYLASIGAPAAVIATAEATNVAMGATASQVGSTAAAEVAGTVPPGTTAEVVASQPVAPTGAETAVTGPAAPTPELNILNEQQTAELMKNVDPNMVNGLQPGATGTASGTAGTTTPGIGGDTIFSGQSINPITNAITNAGITNPIASGALTGAASTGLINLATGQPITAQGLLTGAIGGGVAGGIGGAMSAPTSVFDAALKGAATNVGAGIVVNAVTGQPITATTLAMGAVVGGVIGAGAQVIGSVAGGNTTYRYDDGSTLTVNSSGAPVSVTDFNGASVPVTKINVPVEDRVGTPVNPAAPTAPPAGTVAVQAPDGSILYTDGQNYYTADGSLTDISNPTPGGQTQEVRLSPGNQQIITDATNDYNSGRAGWDETSSRINQAVRNDINSGYLTNNGDGSYTAPDGTIYFMNNTTGMYDSVAGVPGGTGVGSDTAPVVPTDQPPAPAVVAPPPVVTTTPITTTTPPTTTPPAVVAPAVPVDTTPITTTPITTTPITTTPITTTPITTTTAGPVAPGGGVTAGGGTGTTPGAGGTSTTGGVGTGGSGGGVGAVDTGIPEIVVTDTRLPPPVPPVYVPPVVVTPPPAPVAPVRPTPPVVEPPVVEPPVVEPPVVEPPVVEPPPVPPGPTAPPIYVPPYVPPVIPFSYGPIKPLDWSKGVPIGAQGLNPGYITNVPAQYQTQNMQQTKFYYGPKPYQSGGATGQVFDPALYRSSPAAPVTPFGLQQMYNPQTQTIENLLQGVRQASAVAPYNMPAAPRV